MSGRQLEITVSGDPTITCEGCVSLDRQDVLFETEKCFFLLPNGNQQKDLPKYIIYQLLAAVARVTESFFLLQCRTRGATPKSLFPTQLIDDAPLASLRPRLS